MNTNMTSNMKSNLLAGALVALGLTLSGLFIYCGISKFAPFLSRVSAPVRWKRIMRYGRYLIL